MARKWQIAKSCSDSETCTTTSVAHKGRFTVYTCEGKRFMVPLEYLDSKIFQELFRMSEEEYGLPVDGSITLHCNEVFVKYIMLLLKKQVSKDVERALLSSILVPYQSSCSSLAVVHEQQVAVCGFWVLQFRIRIVTLLTIFVYLFPHNFGMKPIDICKLFEENLPLVCLMVLQQKHSIIELPKKKKLVKISCYCPIRWELFLVKTKYIS